MKQPLLCKSVEKISHTHFSQSLHVLSVEVHRTIVDMRFVFVISDVEDVEVSTVRH